MLIIAAIMLLVVIGAAVGGYLWYSSKQKAAAAEEADTEEPVAAHVVKGPPTFLPLDNFTVNLADPGGERMAQIGITISLTDAHAADNVKLYLPIIRNDILKLIAQRTSAELLLNDGKESLADDVKQVVSKAMGFGEDAHPAKPNKKSSATAKKKKAPDPIEDNPVKGVVFSSFIVQ